MEEIDQIADEVTIMRDGKWIETKPVSEITTDEIINLMVGRDLSHRFPEKTNRPGEVILKVENLTATYQPSIQDVSFELRKGEILGIAALWALKEQSLLNLFLVHAMLKVARYSCTEKKLRIRIHMKL